jgi:hypothetical protein
MWSGSHDEHNAQNLKIADYPASEHKRAMLAADP